MSGPRTASPSVPQSAAPLPDGLAVVGVAVYTLVGVLSAIIEVLLIPLYVGSHIFPVTVLIAVVVNVALPALIRVMVDWRWATALPLVAWLVTTIVLGFVNTGSGSVLVPGDGADGYVGLALYFVGTLAGFVGVVRNLGPSRLGSAPTGPTAPAGPTGPTGAVRR